MNHDENPDDSILAQELRDSLSELAVPERPPLAAITSRGRACQRRRWLAGFVGLGGATAAAGIALALGLTSVFGAPPVPGTGTVQGAAFTLTSYANGTVSLRLGQLFDPAVLQRVLERRGIRALVKTDTYCSSSPIRIGVLPGPVSAGARHRAAPGPGGGQGIRESVTLPVKPSQLAPMVDPITMVINPAAMPSGTELYIGFFSPGYTVFSPGYTVFVDLIYTSSHTCRNSPQPPTTP